MYIEDFIRNMINYRNHWPTRYGELSLVKDKKKVFNQLEPQSLTWLFMPNIVFVSLSNILKFNIKKSLLILQKHKLLQL